MTPNQQRSAIALLCGYEQAPEHKIWYLLGEETLAGFNRGKERIEPLPDYLNDHNAMAQAEQHPDLDQDKYSNWLWVVVTDTPIPVQDPWDAINENAFPQFDLYSAALFRSATAAQRAKAFLLTFDPSLTFC